ncbi:replicative DNA helicase [Streptomyces angustmyceticus]|uniref:replicative DNA helicase n=1 Tax=Streptomyces angustmyceticus TaxID=285578 RepID=UPI00344F7B9A
MTVLPHQAAGAPDDYQDNGTALGRTPPHDLGAEKAALAAMMFSPEAVIDCQGAVREEDYLLPKHRILHSLMVERHGKGLPNAWPLLADELEQRGLLKEAGGSDYLTEVSMAFETGAVGWHYAEIVHRKGVLRRLTEAGVRITQAGFRGEGTVDELVAQAAAEISTVAEGASSSDDHDFVLPAEALADALDYIEQARHRKGISGLATGYVDFDELTQGLQPGQLIVIAGRPGMGKSTVAMDIARNCAIKQGVPGAFISLEMPVRELMMRLISAEGGVALHHIRSGQMTTEDMAKMDKAIPKIYGAQLHINDCERTYTAIQAKLRRLKAKHPDIGVIVIDYLQLMKLGGHRPESRQQEVSEISSSLKLLAKELQVPIIALAQLNRGPEMRTDKKPAVSDLRESGAIEQDADIVILLHRDDAYEAESPRAGEVDLIVGKHRNGPTATITVASQLHYSRFVDMAQT